ncbi:hypothetical protein EA749_00705 [Acinetobacter radioresistens]|uniref:hypothetical protein n=1 Tax=Acinetobacter radioresistens TaxID=40216 RepID=UPI00037A6F7C|nr:hypothetical protein [Acinetobacter radioresistens]PKD80117.1 hypothetical protein CW313_14095 [Acinetobacter radioresistens]PKH30216.1 hypothetical protein BJF94_11355 [Acinetobacter radioresistens]PSD36771.1 hypothetical protein C7E16_05095 [Acinetobacter radioresistens]PSD37560.1 hypothetical protein C7E21_10990 [Acinetobacter radioresistens]RSO70762.1 hypothetical protein EA749_00705 [Acinetobacter radioresistens]
MNRPNMRKAKILLKAKVERRSKAFIIATGLLENKMNYKIKRLKARSSVIRNNDINDNKKGYMTIPFNLF